MASGGVSLSAELSTTSMRRSTVKTHSKVDECGWIDGCRVKRKGKKREGKKESGDNFLS